MRKSTASFIKAHPLLVVFFSVLILITTTLVIIALSIQMTTEIEIKVTPISATVLIDDKSYENGKFRISSGEHQIKIEKDGFITKEYNFNTNTTDKLYDYLLESDGSYNWYLTHKEDALLLTSIGDYESKLASEAYNSKHPIIDKLPIIYANYDENYNYTEYRIDGGSFTGCDTDFCLKITDTTGNNYEAAKQKIRDAGFNPDDFQILYEFTPIQAL